MNIKIISVGPYEVNCAVVWGDAKQALIIDPGYDAPLIQSCLDANDLTVAAYLLTHGHADHISALAELHAAQPAPVYLHAEDERWAFGQNNQIPPHYPVPTKPACEILHPEVSNDWKKLAPFFQTLEVGSTDEPIVSQSLERNSKPQRSCLETPGHTPGGVCYW